MTKKEYMKPTMSVVKIQQQNIICGTTQGLNNQLQGTDNPEDEVEDGWSRRRRNVWDEEEE